MWREARALAGDSKKEWAYPWQACRVRMMRYSTEAAGEYFYEPIFDFDNLRVASVVNAALEEAGADEWTAWSSHVGFKAFDSIYRAPKGRLQLPKEGERYHGRHFVRVIGWDDDTDALVFVNSWSDWGDNQIGYMSREYFERYADHADIERSVLVGMNPPNHGSFSIGEPGWPSKWMQPNRRYVRRLDHDGAPYDRVRYEAISVDWDCRVEILELKRPEPDERRLAWAHLYHARGDASVIREFFVAPEVRRGGWGTVLDRFARGRAAEAGSEEIALKIQEADRGTLSGALAFLRSCGYETEDVPQRQRPVLIAAGRRAV
jgi:GNAT superfamily N-acetyltransferase